MKRTIQILSVIALVIFIIISLPQVINIFKDFNFGNSSNELFEQNENIDGMNQENETSIDNLADILDKALYQPILLEQQKCFLYEKNKRYKAVTNRMKDIREAEFAYKKANGKFTEKWDTLISFLKNDNSVLCNKITYPIEQLKIIPVKDTIAEFHIKVASLKSNLGTSIPVFELKAHNNTVLKGLNIACIINLNDSLRSLGKYPGLKIGAINEDNGAKANWEE